MKPSFPLVALMQLSVFSIELSAQINRGFAVNVGKSRGE